MTEKRNVEADGLINIHQTLSLIKIKEGACELSSMSNSRGFSEIYWQTRLSFVVALRASIILSRMRKMPLRHNIIAPDYIERLAPLLEPSRVSSKSSKMFSLRHEVLTLAFYFVKFISNATRI